PAIRVRVDALHDSQAGEQVEGAEDGGPAYAGSLPSHGFKQVGGGKGRGAAYYLLHDGAALAGQAIALSAEALQDCFYFGHRLVPNDERRKTNDERLLSSFVFRRN